MSGPLIVSYGGGVNSVAMLVGMKARAIVPDAVVFSDTRGEKPETYDHMASVVSPWLASAGFPTITTVCRADFPNSRVGDESLEAECLRLGTLPSRAYGFGTCADKWKIDPFKWWARSWQPAVDAWDSAAVVTRAIGYDAGEERRVGPESDRGFAKWFPLIEWGWDRDRCIAEIRAAGLSIPPKSACFFCPSSTKAEILALRAKRTALYERALAIEERALSTGRWAVAGLGRRFSWRDLGEADAAQRALFPEAPVESCTICADGEPE